MKGAVERVLQHCATLYVPESVNGCLQLDERGRQAIMSKAREYCHSGLRGMSS